MLDWAGGSIAFKAFGTSVFNAGMAIVPATLTEQGLASHGRLSLTMERGRLLEARWFPEDEALENKYFGGAPAPDGPGVAETAFLEAAALSITLHRAIDEDTLLQLYALYKQGSIGDVTDTRPGALDVVGRTKYDRWAARKGQSREEAMGQYVALVQRLKELEVEDRAA